ncbi:MAG: Mut7-C RNAse domain-containing protein [Desulfatiglandales bacterium]|jgi:hypothetical protein|nr:Mut7-C RNAse domain-containing protein [Desulfatiglandales bacterium]
MEVKFVADSMLGRLAKWLRALGYDTHYQPFYKEGIIKQLTSRGRMLLYRQRSGIIPYPNSMLIHSGHVKDQLHEMKNQINLTSDRSKWFSRYLSCNVPLKVAEAGDALENVPEYVFYQSPSGIRACPYCGRYFWPGSHRERMIRQLEKWGF